MVFSIAVIAYNNSEYLFDNLRSIFYQDYQHIELLVSDDASLHFDKEQVVNFIETNKKSNILRFFVWQQERNLGTVAHAEFCRQKASGAMFFLVAADDVLDNSSVLTRMYKAAFESNLNMDIVSGQVKQCNIDLSETGHNWASSSEVDLIRSGNNANIFSKLSNRTFIPTTGTCYRMSFLESMGGYDRSYRLIEDAPLYLKSARLGARFGWIDDMIIAKHRAGGLLHKKLDYKDKAFRMYIKDRMRIFRYEVFPYIGQIHETDINPMLMLWYLCRTRYELAYSSNFLKRIFMRIRNNTAATVLFSFCFRGEPNLLTANIKAFIGLTVKHARNSYHNCKAFAKRIINKLQRRTE